MVIKRVNPISAGKVMGSALSATSDRPGAAVFGLLMGAGAIIIVPIFYGVIMFIGGIIQAALYNLAAKWMGGIEVETA